MITCDLHACVLSCSANIELDVAPWHVHHHLMHVNAHNSHIPLLMTVVNAVIPGGRIDAVNFHS